MKSFLEEYGFAILAAIVVILLIVMATPVGSTIKEQVSGLVNSMSRSTSHKLQSSDNEISVILTTTPSLTITSKSNTDKFKYIVHYVENGEEKQTSPKDYQSTGFELGCNPDKHSDLYVEVIDIGTDKHYFSNVITVPNNGLSVINISPNTIIELENRNYVILQSKGNNQYLIMDIDGIGTKQFNIDRNGQDPNKCGYISGVWKGETCNHQYENSNIDVDLNETYYNNLSQEIKNAIIEQNIEQSFYKQTWINNNYRWIPTVKPLGTCTGWCVKQSNETWLPWDQHNPIKGQPGAYKYTNKGSENVNIIKRKVFLPSIEEISQVVNVNDQWEVDKLLRNSSEERMHMWFRNGYINANSYIINSNYISRSLNNTHIRNTNVTARPTFMVDLSKIEFRNTNNQFIK